MVLTCFDELKDTKGIVPMRGDLISNLHEDEGEVIMKSLLEKYLVDSQYETVRKFNHEPATFDFETYIKEALVNFAELKSHVEETKAPKIELGKYKKHGHKTDKELNIHKGGIIR